MLCERIRRGGLAERMPLPVTPVTHPFRFVFVTGNCLNIFDIARGGLDVANPHTDVAATTADQTSVPVLRYFTISRLQLEDTQRCVHVRKRLVKIPGPRLKSDTRTSEKICPSIRRLTSGVGCRKLLGRVSCARTAFIKGFRGCNCF